MPPLIKAGNYATSPGLTYNLAALPMHRPYHQGSHGEISIRRLMSGHGTGLNWCTAGEVGS